MLKKKAKGIQTDSVCEICKKKTKVLYDNGYGKKVCKECLKGKKNE